VSNILSEHKKSTSSASKSTAPSSPSLETLADETFALVETESELQTQSQSQPTILTDQANSEIEGLEEQIKTKQAELSQLEIEVAELRREIDQ
jgi:hypothetical protein